MLHSQLAHPANAFHSPTFSLELKNQAFNSHFAIANNVIPELGELTLTLPVIPPG